MENEERKEKDLSIRFLSMDPSMNNTALVYGVINDGIVYPQGYHISKTKKDKSFSVAQDTVRRSSKTLDLISRTIAEFKPDVCFAETPTGSQSASAQKSYGLSCAFIALLSPKAVLVTPSQVKIATGGLKTASKDFIMNWAESNYKEFPFPRKKDGSLLKGEAEHICDAIAITIAGLKKLNENNIQKSKR